MAITRIPRRGAIRCEVAADVARELLSIADQREHDAHRERNISPSQAGFDGSRMNAAMLDAEANALRSVAYAIGKHNVQA